jgi:hypothetical protein
LTVPSLASLTAPSSASLTLKAITSASLTAPSLDISTRGRAAGVGGTGGSLLSLDLCPSNLWSLSFLLPLPPN